MPGKKDKAAAVGPLGEVEANATGTQSATHASAAWNPARFEAVDQDTGETAPVPWPLPVHEAAEPPDTIEATKAVVDSLTGEVLPRNSLTVEEWAAAIRKRWQDSVHAIFDVGRMLCQARAQKSPEEWQQLLAMLPFNKATASMLRRIVHPDVAHLQEVQHAEFLPPSWYTLYLLSKLERDEFEAGVAAGIIRSDMDRRVAEKLLGNGINALKAFSGNNEYYTPGQFLEAAREVMGEIDLDPASCAMAQETVRAKRYFTEEDDGLAQRWEGRVWLNPPYAAGLIDKFAQKLVQELDAGRVDQAIVLVDNRTDTAWFHHLADACDRVCFTRGRINFYNENTASSSPANGSALLYFGSKPGRFERVFSRFGWGGPVTFVRGSSKEAADAA